MRVAPLLAVCLMLSPALARTAAAAELSQLRTDDLQLVWFHPTEDYLAPYVARSFENSMAFQRSQFGWQPDGAVNVLLKDFGDYGNAAARSNPNNALMVDIAPLSFSFETFVASERMFSLMNHELVHVANMDQWTAQDRRWRRLFGGKVRVDPEHPLTLLYHYLTTPRVVVPRWYLEGVAVFYETWMSGGFGRAQGAYDEMVFRAMVRDGAPFYDPRGLAAEGTRVDFQVGVNNYLYGARFVCWLAYHYTPEHITRWVARTEGSERYYADQFEQVFGKSMEAAWQDWIAFEREFQAKNLAQVRQHPLTPVRRLSQAGLGSISRAFHDPANDRIYAAFRYPGVAAYVGAMSLADGTLEPIEDVKGPMLYRVASLAWDPQDRTLYYTADNNAGYRDIIALDADSGRSRLLFKDARIGELVFDPATRTLWGLRHLNGIVTLVRMPPPYTDYRQVYSFPYGQIAYDLDISPDGKLASMSLATVDGNQSLRVYALDQLGAGDATPIDKFDFGSAVPEGFVFSSDGRWLYGSSYYTGVSNLFRYELATRKLEALSNAETGLFRPLPLPDGRLLAFEYTGTGFVPGFVEAKPLEDVGAITFLGAQIAKKHPVVTTWKVGSPAAIDLDKHVTHEGDYTSLTEMRLQSYYPVLEGYKDSVAGGVQVNFSDPIGLDTLKLVASYSPDSDLPDSERKHFEAQFRHRSLSLGFEYNDADFYDLFGPTKTSRRGRVWTAGYDRALIFDTPRRLDFEAELAWRTNLDNLPAFQDVPVTTDELLSLALGLDYTYVLNSLGSVDDEKGMRWDLNLVTQKTEEDTIFAAFGRFDIGWPLPLDHASLWLLTSAGWSNGRADDPFANYFLGGFGNNYVDKGEIKRYRDHFSFPGFEISELGGRTYARAIAELNLPPLRFSGVGTPANYLSWARPALFASYLAINPDDAPLRRELQNVGVQVDLQFYVMHVQDMTLSAGYAIGFEQGDRVDDEFMLSLKVLY